MFRLLYPGYYNVTNYLQESIREVFKLDLFYFTSDINKLGRQDNISIVVASDNHYAILLAALIKSIEENHKTGEKIDFYILDDGILPKNKEKLQSTINPAITTLYWYKTSTIVPKDITIPIDHTAIPFTTYYRLFAAHVVPVEVKRVIYLDADMVSIEDISKLWYTDIEGKLFAAVQDWQLTVSCSWGGIPNYKQLGIHPDTKYFNAGLMVMDTDKWREQDVTKRIIKFMHENINFINFADQYGLNAVLYDQWFVLDPSWNWFAQFENKNPFIIHFLDIKPIFKTYRSKPEFREEFYKYLRMTPWKDYKPVSHYKRLFKKIVTKLKKESLRLLA